MTDEPLSVSFAELRSSFDVVLRHMEAAAAGDAVALDNDYFWSIPPNDLYDVTRTPDELTIGQLSESWQHLRDVVADPDRALSHHLTWLADVLRAIAHEHPA
ncbi:hypothetical protein ACFVVA_06895 [Kitasatospora sp. NPDC058048]|uniref:hypothetical protein n=1 Tax=Kitasatospora sp. NPDC058048 TaxID=3346313 RepID=UPI0036DEFC91